MNTVVPKLVEASGLHDSVVTRIISTAPHRYKEFTIDKRNGGKRKIAQPAKELKILQRAFVVEFLRKLPIHDAAMAYRENLSIKDNARKHAGFGPILKMDFKDFFPSITEKDWHNYCEVNGIFESKDDIHLSSLLLFHKPKGASKLRLAIGAPSSPILSNILMYKFDEHITSQLESDKIIYTRYADDLTFSAPRTGYLTGVKKTVYKAIRDIEHPNLRINRDKTVYITTKYHRSVTGLTLANDGRVTLGRDRKREMRSAVHHFQNDKLDPVAVQKLAGLIAFAHSVEPAFVKSLSETYGAATLSNLSKANIRSKKYF